MHTLLKRFWNDEAGFIISAELIMICTLLVLGLIVGVTSLQSALVAEYHDLAAAFSSLDQSYRFGGFFARGFRCRSKAFTAGSFFLDRRCIAGYASSGGDFAYVPGVRETVVESRTIVPEVAPCPSDDCIPCETADCPRGDCPPTDCPHGDCEELKQPCDACQPGASHPLPAPPQPAPPQPAPPVHVPPAP